MDASYDLTPEQLVERIPSCDALIIRSATKVLAFGKSASAWTACTVFALPNPPLDIAHGHADRELNPPLRPDTVGFMHQRPCMPTGYAPAAWWVPGVCMCLAGYAVRQT